MTATSRKSRKRGWENAASIFALGLGAGLGAAGQAEAIVTPDTVPPAAVVDTANENPWIVGLAVRNEAGNSGSTCTGLLINPRTVLFAAHCVDALDPNQYDADAPGNRAQVGYTTDGTFGRTNLREYLFPDFGQPPGDARTITARSVNVWYDPRSRFGPMLDPNGGTFLPADIAIAAFDTPNDLLGRDAENGVGLLFSPVDRLVAVEIAGYGQSGNGMTSFRTPNIAGVEDSFFRRVATNMLGYLGSERDLSLGVYPAAVADITDPGTFNYQDLYWIDFDDPLNRPFDANIATANFGPSTGTNPGATTTLDFNVFPDSHTANEAVTAAGNSGGPLVTSAYGRDVSLAVLSQGSRFFHDAVGFPDDNGVFFTAFSNFGTVAGYNPLFLFWDQIVVNNPYKYVQARSGNREWTNASTWVQEMDPLYFTLKNGSLRNQLPNTPALGSSDDAANRGTINPNPAPPAACAFTGTCPPTGGGADPIGLANAAMPGVETLDGSQASHGGHHGGPPPPPPPPPGPSTADWLTGGLIPVMSGALTGPGTTGFVPNNTNGTPGLQNSARFFEVNLRNHGTLSLTNATVTIDRLNIRGIGSELNIRSNARLNTLMSSYMDVGQINVDGVFNPLMFDIGLGIVSGRGRIIAPGGVANLAGVISPGGNSIGTLTIDGDYAQSGWGTVFYQIHKNGTTDRLVVNGDVNMQGNLLVDSDRKLRFGDRYTVVTGQTITGNFDRTFGSGTLLFGTTVADADSIHLVISAHSLWSWFGGGGSFWSSLANALDNARNGHYLQLSGVFDTIDYVPLDSLEFVMPTIAPTNAFQTVPLAVGYQRDFMTSLDGRTAELRSGVRGMSQRSLMNGFRIAQAGAEQDENGSALSSGLGSMPEMGDRFGMFVSGHGNLSTVGNEGYEDDRYNPSSLSSMSSAQMTVGADYRVNDNFAIGVATTMSRYLSRDRENTITPLEHTGYGAMLYASTWEGGWYADFYVGVAKHEYATSRMPGLALDYSADAAPGATQTLAGVRAGWTFEPVQGLFVGPSVAMNYSNLMLDGYRESGGGDFALDIDGRSLTSMTVESGIDFTYQPSSNGRASPFATYGRVALVSEIGDSTDYVSARFVAAPDVAFDVSRPLSGEWVSATTGFSYQLGQQSSLYLEGSSDMGREQLENTSVRAGFNVRF